MMSQATVLRQEMGIYCLFGVPNTIITLILVVSLHDFCTVRIRILGFCYMCLNVISYRVLTAKAGLFNWNGDSKNLIKWTKRTINYFAIPAWLLSWGSTQHLVNIHKKDGQCYYQYSGFSKF